MYRVVHFALSLAVCLSLISPSFAADTVIEEPLQTSTMNEPYICSGYPVPERTGTVAADKNLNLPIPRIEQESLLTSPMNEFGMCSGYPVPEETDMVDIANNAESAFVPLISQEPRGILSYITVYVSSPCDQYWRTAFPNNWMYMANYAVEEGDNFLADKFNIDYISVAQTYWNNTNTDSYDQYYDARDNIGKTNGANLMIAFSANRTTVGGLGAASGHCVVWYFDYAGIEYSCNTVTHESGHMYGIHTDGGCLTPCLMSGTPKSICDACYSIWYGNRYNW